MLGTRLIGAALARRPCYHTLSGYRPVALHPTLSDGLLLSNEQPDVLSAVLAKSFRGFACCIHKCLKLNYKGVYSRGPSTPTKSS